MRSGKCSGSSLVGSGAPGKGRALGVGEVKFSGMVEPTVKKLEYIVELRRVIRRKFTLGTGDGWLKADGETDLHGQGPAGRAVPGGRSRIR